MAKKAAAKKAAKKAAAVPEETPDQVAEAEVETVSTHLGEGVQKGDVVLVDLLGKLKNGKAFYATNKKDAVREGIFTDKHAYTPELVIVGEKGFLLPALVDDLEQNSWKVGDERTIDLEAEKAFGKREGSKIRMITSKEFKKKTGNVPKIGGEYRDPKSGETGYVIRLGQGRTIVDFNHPLAGKDVVYTVKVVDKLTEEMDTIKAVISKNGPGLDINLLKIERKDADLEIEIPQAYMFSNLMYFKLNVGLEITRYIEGIEHVKFIEVFEKIKMPEAPAVVPAAEPVSEVAAEEAVADAPEAAEPAEEPKEEE
jgi:FKBP-type peptidyl-prolyl cis-trans isomerase 2